MYVFIHGNLLHVIECCNRVSEVFCNDINNQTNKSFIFHSQCMMLKLHTWVQLTWHICSNHIFKQCIVESHVILGDNSALFGVWFTHLLGTLPITSAFHKNIQQLIVKNASAWNTVFNHQIIQFIVPFQTSLRPSNTGCFGNRLACYTATFCFSRERVLRRLRPIKTQLLVAIL